MHCRCACGWSGEIGKLIKHPEGGQTTCPTCGASGGLLFDLPPLEPDQAEYIRRIWEAGRPPADLSKIKIGRGELGPAVEYLVPPPPGFEDDAPDPFCLDASPIDDSKERSMSTTEIKDAIRRLSAAELVDLLWGAVTVATLRAVVGKCQTQLDALPRIIQPGDR